MSDEKLLPCPPCQCCKIAPGKMCYLGIFLCDTCYEQNTRPQPDSAEVERVTGLLMESLRANAKELCNGDIGYLLWDNGLSIIRSYISPLIASHKAIHFGLGECIKERNEARDERDQLRSELAAAQQEIERLKNK